MHAAVVSVSMTSDVDPEEVATHLREKIVPMVSQVPGFVGAYWVILEGAQGRAMIVFESEEAARGASEKLEPAPGVTIDSVDVGKVIAHA